MMKSGSLTGEEPHEYIQKNFMGGYYYETY